jgi:hypothetical protein
MGDLPARYSPSRVDFSPNPCLSLRVMFRMFCLSCYAVATMFRVRPQLVEYYLFVDLRAPPRDETRRMERYYIYWEKLQALFALAYILEISLESQQAPR